MERIRRRRRPSRRNTAALVLLVWCFALGSVLADAYEPSPALRGTNEPDGSVRRGMQRVRKRLRNEAGQKKPRKLGFRTSDNADKPRLSNNIFLNREYDVDLEENMEEVRENKAEVVREPNRNNPAEDRLPQRGVVSPYELGATGYGYILGGHDRDPSALGQYRHNRNFEGFKTETSHESEDAQYSSRDFYSVEDSEDAQVGEQPLRSSQEALAGGRKHIGRQGVKMKGTKVGGAKARTAGDSEMPIPGLEEFTPVNRPKGKLPDSRTGSSLGGRPPNSYRANNDPDEKAAELQNSEAFEKSNGEMTPIDNTEAFEQFPGPEDMSLIEPAEALQLIPMPDTSTESHLGDGFEQVDVVGPTSTTQGHISSAFEQIEGEGCPLCPPPAPTPLVNPAKPEPVASSQARDGKNGKEKAKATSRNKSEKGQRKKNKGAKGDQAAKGRKGSPSDQAATGRKGSPDGQEAKGQKGSPGDQTPEGRKGSPDDQKTEGRKGSPEGKASTPTNPSNQAQQEPNERTGGSPTGVNTEGYYRAPLPEGFPEPKGGNKAFKEARKKEGSVKGVKGMKGIARKGPRPPQPVVEYPLHVDYEEASARAASIAATLQGRTRGKPPRPRPRSVYPPKKERAVAYDEVIRVSGKLKKSGGDKGTTGKKGAKR